MHIKMGRVVTSCYANCRHCAPSIMDCPCEADFTYDDAKLHGACRRRGRGTFCSSEQTHEQLDFLPARVWKLPTAVHGLTLMLRMNGSYAVLRKWQQNSYSASRARMALWLIGRSVGGRGQR